MTNLVPIGNPEDLPEAMPYRTGRQKYPWSELKPGDWFKFSASVKPGSARVMASQTGNALAVQFHVFMGKDGALYCRRIDGLPIQKKWQPIPKDAFGNVMLPTADIHSGEPPEAAGSGRVYGHGGQNGKPMPGEVLHLGDAETVEGEDDAIDI